MDNTTDRRRKGRIQLLLFFFTSCFRLLSNIFSRTEMRF